MATYTRPLATIGSPVGEDPNDQARKRRCRSWAGRRQFGDAVRIECVESGRGGHVDDVATHDDSAETAVAAVAVAEHVCGPPGQTAVTRRGTSCQMVAGRFSTEEVVGRHC